MSKLMMQPYETDPASISFARSRAAVTERLAREFRAQRIDAMIYPTMPFPAPRAVDPWPDIRTTLGTIPQLPSKRDYDEIVRRLKAAQTALMPKVQELRDVADWQRWANVGIQEQLCEKMEALKALDRSLAQNARSGEQ